MDHPTPTSRLVNTSQCSNLRHKGMYVTSAPDPGEEQFYDAYDATAYWCLRTMKAVGPDGQPVHRDACSAGSHRGCCVD
jgi:hypothetical protein